MSFERNDSANTYEDFTSHPDGYTQLISDSSGELIGSFIIPNVGNKNFQTVPSKEFKLLDISGGEDDNSISKASTQFIADGKIETKQNNIITTRVQDVFNVIQVDRPRPRRRTNRNRDPLAQSFIVDDNEFENGIFVTKLDLYFDTKSDNPLSEVEVQIRGVHKVFLTRLIYQVLWRIKKSDQVNIPANRNDLENIKQNGTEFEFDYPIYLEPGKEYAIVVLADNVDYNVYVSKIYDFIIGSTEKKS